MSADVQELLSIIEEMWPVWADAVEHDGTEEGPRRVADLSERAMVVERRHAGRKRPEEVGR